MPPRNRIIMIKTRTPKRVTLPDGRTFLARYRRATRNELPRNVNLIRPYKQRAAPKGKRKRRRVNQHGTGFGSTLKKAVNFGKKAFNSKLGKKIARTVISKLPYALETVGGKVKNKRLKKILTSDLARTGADYATGLALEKLQ